MRHLTAEELRRFLAHAQGDRLEALFVLAANTGSYEFVRAAGFVVGLNMPSCPSPEQA
ncbi:MAG: hypothetical protein ACREPI_00110 [Candidatus Dormibacterales bacterium]